MPWRISPSPSSLLLISLVFFLSLFISINAYPVTTPPNPSCKNTTCGEVLVAYPFWIAPDPITFPSSGCGYLEFMLICQNNNTLIISLGYNNYTVTQIDYSTQTISLTDADFVAADDTCPRPRHNLTLLGTYFLNVTWLPNFPSFLRYTSSDVNLTFLLNCSSKGPKLDNQITCFGDRSYIFTDKNISTAEESGLMQSCQSKLVVPVLKEELDWNNESALSSDFGGALKKGFQLGWPNETWVECDQCELSGGRCGALLTSSSLAFACFCPNGESDHHCGHSNKEKIIIGVATGGGVFFVMCALWLLWHRYTKSKRLSPSSKRLIRNSSLQASPKAYDPELGSAHYQTHVFTYDELQEATNCFDCSRELGDGGFGTVYRGKLQDGRVVAVKRLYENNYKRVEQFMNEIDILSRLRHPNLVSLYGCTSHRSRELLLVYEFVPKGTVADHLHGSHASERALTWPIRLNIAIETADALSYLHAVEPQIIHRDVKTNNILLDSSFHVKVADFGLSRLFPRDATHVSTAPQGTPGYLDPEYHQCYQLTDRSDVYSFGVVLVELISSKPAVDITRHRHEINLSSMAINKIQNCQLEELVDASLGYQSDWAIKKMITMVAEVAFRCLQSDGEMRPPIKEVLDVLREIKRRGYEAETEAVTDAGMRDDAGLLKNLPPFSPVSVTAKWLSSSTTPSTSG